MHRKHDRFDPSRIFFLIQRVETLSKIKSSSLREMSCVDVCGDYGQLVYTI